METYLFDFDGTLVDSMPTYVHCMLKILDDHHIPYGEDIVKTITPLGVIGTAEHFIGMGLKLPLEHIVELMKENMMDAYLYRIQAKPHVCEVLKALKERGAALNVLTASPHVTLDPCLKRLGLFDLFDNVWSCNDFNTTKSDPAIYHTVAEKLGKHVEDILFLDDNYDADLTAKQAGMKVCGVFDESSREYEQEIRAITDQYIYDFCELIALDT